MLKQLLVLSSLCFSLLAQEKPAPEVPAPAKPGAEKVEPAETENPVAEKVAQAEAEGYWKYHHTASISYRRDRQTFKQDDTRASYDARNSLQLVLATHLEFKHLVFHLRANYGWLVNGNFSFFGNRFGEPLDFGSFDLGAGYAADARAAVGFKIEPYKCPNFQLVIIPSAGYQYSHLMNFPEGEKRVESSTGSGFALASFPSANQQDWFGPFAEARLEMLFWEKFEWSFFYQYQWLAMRSKSNENVSLYLFNPPGTATSIELFRSHVVVSAWPAQKQLGGTDLIYHSSKGWNFGLHFEGFAAWTDHARTVAQRRPEEYIGTPVATTTKTDTPTSIHWVCYEADISLGYQF